MDARYMAKLELSELTDRWHKVCDFIANNPKYQRMSASNQELLMQQCVAMGTYKDVLSERLRTWKEV